MVVSGTSRASSRLAGLDVMRGLAALSVLFYHGLLAVPLLSESRPWRDGQAVDWAWLVSHTPVRALWAGGAAVTLFFVMSGFVLTIAADRPNAPRWADYYPRRILRLYIPVVGAVIAALIWIALVPRVTAADASWWVRGAHQPTLTGVAKDLTLLQPGATTSVLWSLTWEVVFSLLLPLYLLTVARTRRWPVLGIVASVGLAVVGELVGSTALQFLPVFGIGCYLAAMRHSLPALVGDRWERGRGWRNIAVTLVLAQGFTLPFLLTGLTLEGRAWTAIGSSAMLVSCAVAVAIMAIVEPARESVHGTSLRWLGSRSFSVYLVHEPIIISVAILFAGHASPWWTLPIALPVSLIVAEAFFRVVERPAIKLARTFEWPTRVKSRRVVAHRTDPDRALSAPEVSTRTDSAPLPPSMMVDG